MVTARELLNKGCALDLHPRSFEAGRSPATSRIGFVTPPRNTESATASHDGQRLSFGAGRRGPHEWRLVVHYAGVLEHSELLAIELETDAVGVADVEAVVHAAVWAEVLHSRSVHLGLDLGEMLR